MCGIVGYVGNKNAVDVMHGGLLKLEYRGYDSAGISYFDKAKICTRKSAGTVENLFDHIEKNLCSNIAIGHTRWATHGKANDQNSHPHVSEKGKVSLVHNGIIENYLDLKNEFLSGTQLKSETDTEVVANVLEKILIETNDKIIAISKLVKLLKGSYALAILFDDDDKNIYFTKNISPLMIGSSENGNYISSDILGFCEEATKYLEVKNLQIGKISAKNIEIFDKNGKKIDFLLKFFSKNQNSSDKEGYPHFMLKEINEVPKVIKNACNLYLSGLANLIDFDQKNNISNFEASPFLKFKNGYFDNIKKIKLIACGTSYHASKVGELLFKSIGYNASSEIASEFIYSPQVFSRDTLCIFISQSGETADTLTAINIAKKHKLKTIGITNVETSTITKLCDYILPLVCGAEIAVASTKAYNSQLCVLQMFAAYLKFLKTTKQNIALCDTSHKNKIKNDEMKNYTNLNEVTNYTKSKNLIKNQQIESIIYEKNIKKLQKSIKKLQNITKKINILSFDNQIKDILQNVVLAKKILMVGKNFDYVLAMESALKLKEISYLSTEAYPSGELKHGTIALVDESTLVFAFVTEKKLVDKTMNVIKQTMARGAKIVLVTPFENLIDDSITNYILLPKIEEEFYPIISIIPMQLLAYRVSVTLGNNPDKPRNLAKSVTVE